VASAEAISIALKDMGMKVAANYAGNDERAREFSDRTGIQTYKWDVADQTPAWRRRQGRGRARPVDVLVNNAGITRDTTMKRMDHQKWQEVIDTNLGGCFNMAKAVFEGMQSRGYGRIVNIGSINGQAGQYGQVNYAAAKSGIHGFTKALAQEGAAQRRHRQRHRAGLYRHRHGRRGAAGSARKIVARIPSTGSARPRNRPRRRVPGRRECRLRHRVDAVDQRRPAHVMMSLGKPTKRSVTIAGHETSISLEPLFWQALERAARDEGLPVNALIARIDVERLEASGGAPNLTSAIRQWLYLKESRLG
jgi:predicted DNA-binding ribbon-helix-helix protein